MSQKVKKDHDYVKVVDNPVCKPNSSTKSQKVSTSVQASSNSQKNAHTIRQEMLEKIYNGILPHLKILYNEKHSISQGSYPTLQIFIENKSINVTKSVEIVPEYPILLPDLIIWKVSNNIDLVTDAWDPEPSNIGIDRQQELIDELSKLIIELEKGWTICPIWYTSVVGDSKAENEQEGEPFIVEEKRGDSEEEDDDDVNGREPPKHPPDAIKEGDSKKENVEEKESSADLVPGIKLSYLLKLFMSRLKPNETDTVDQFLQNWDNDLVSEKCTRKLFLDVLRDEKIDSLVVGNGQVYISCDFDSKIRDVLVSLQEYFRTTPHIFVCMDGITHARQYTWEGVTEVNFEKTIEKIGRLVLVTSNWKTLEESVLKQDSLLYEVYCTTTESNERKCKFDLALSLEDCSLIKEKNGAKEEISKYLAITEQVENDWKTTASKKICDRLIDLLSVPKGIKLSYLLSVLTDEQKFANISIPVILKDGKEKRLNLQLKDLTVNDFLDHCLRPVLMPRFPEEKFFSDYLQQLEKYNEKLVNYAEVFITCELTNNFLSTMNTLREHFNNMPDIYIAMEKITHVTPSAKRPAVLGTHECKMCLQQTFGSKEVSPPLVSLQSTCSLSKSDGTHDWVAISSPPPPPETIFLIDEFEDRIKRIHHVVVVMSPWNNMGYLRRTALLFEIYCASKHKCDFEIALSWYDKKRLIDFFRKGGEDAIKAALDGIDIGSSLCNFPAMRRTVLDAVKDADCTGTDIRTTGANRIIKDSLIEHLKTLTYIPKGIKLSYLLKVFDLMNYEIDKDRETRTVASFMQSLKNKLLKVTGEEEKLYVSYLEEGKLPSEVGSGQVYVSYERQGSFYSTLNTLREHFEKDPDIFVCLDNITHRAPSSGKGTGAVFHIDQFEAAIKQIGHVVVVMSPWNNLRIFRYTSMLFEIHCAITNDCKFEIALSDRDRKELHKAVVNGVVDEMMEGLEWINFDRSVSRFHSLNELVKVAVKPFDIANMLVSNAVRDRLMEQSESKGLCENRRDKESFMLVVKKGKKDYNAFDYSAKTIGTSSENSSDSNVTALGKTDIIVFLEQVHEILSNTSLIAKLERVGLCGNTSFGGLFISLDCTKNHLDFTIESQPTIDHVIMTLHLAVNNKNRQLNAKITIDIVSTIINDFLTILNSRSWEDQFSSLPIDSSKSPSEKEVKDAWDETADTEINKSKTNDKRSEKNFKESLKDLRYDNIYETLRSFLFLEEKAVLEEVTSKTPGELEASEAVEFSLSRLQQDCKVKKEDAHFCIIGAVNKAKLLRKALKAKDNRILDAQITTFDSAEHLTEKDMSEIDVIFTATFSESPIIKPVDLEKLVENRKRPGKLQIVDIADPRNVDIHCEGVDGAHCYNMQQLWDKFSFTRKGRKLQLLNETHFRHAVTVLNDNGENIFRRYSNEVAKTFGKRSPKALKFRDLDVISSFVSAQLKREKYTWKWNEYFHDCSNDAFQDDEDSNDALYQLMMVWESKIEKIEEMDSKTLTIHFETPLPKSYRRYMYRSHREKKLLLLCLNDTEYGGAWRITWIGVSRKMVTCECTCAVEENVSLEEHVTHALRAPWELKERKKDDGSNVKKTVYLDKKRILNLEERVRNAGRAFFAPVPVIYCSCMNYSLLDVNLIEKSFQADAWYHFRLEEIGKDAACEAYVLDYLGRYGFDVDKTIFFPDEITNRAANSQVDKFFHYERKGNSFMYDYTIRIRKQSEFAAGLKMRYFPFDQQRLALEVSLSTAKENIELEYDENGGGLYNTVVGFKVDSHVPQKVANQIRKQKQESEYLYDDNVLADEYKIYYADDAEERRPWVLLDKRKGKAHWKMIFFVLVRRDYSFYISSSLLPLVVFCLLSFLSFGVDSTLNCVELTVNTKVQITLTILLSSVAFKVSISSFLPQIPYFTRLDFFMWVLTYFIGLVALENLAWPAAVCTNIGAHLNQSDETTYVLYALIALLVTLVVLMRNNVREIQDEHEKELLSLRKEGVITKVQEE